jgi:undecaprenyl-diphosphatase
MGTITKISRKHYLLGGSLVILAAIGLYGVLPRFGDFSDSVTALQGANKSLVVAAAAVALTSTAFSALVYKIISVRSIGYGNTLLVQLAGLFINRIVPAGIGGLSLNFMYLRSRKHTVAQASTIVALNNSIGFMGHAVLAVVLFALNPASFTSVHWSGRWLWMVAVVAVIVSIALLILWRSHRPQLRAWKLTARFYSRHPGRLVAGIGVSSLLTLASVVSLWLCCLALDIHIGVFTLFVIFTFGIAAGTATPTPGGLGGIEAALVAGMVTQHVPAATALAAVLLFRLVTYWLGLAIGAGALVAVSRKQLLRA